MTFWTLVFCSISSFHPRGGERSRFVSACARFLRVSALPVISAILPERSSACSATGRFRRVLNHIPDFRFRSTFYVSSKVLFSHFCFFLSQCAKKIHANKSINILL